MKKNLWQARSIRSLVRIKLPRNYQLAKLANHSRAAQYVDRDRQIDPKSSAGRSLVIQNLFTKDVSSLSLPWYNG